MLNDAQLAPFLICVNESDNCTSQCKSAESFYDLPEISNGNEISILRVFGVPGHGKSDGDHVGASQMADYLAIRFQDNKNPSYKVKEIDSNLLPLSMTRPNSRSFYSTECHNL